MLSLRATPQEKRLACERYVEMQEELSGMKGRSEREIQSLKEHLRLAMAALQEGQKLGNSLDHWGSGSWFPALCCAQYQAWNRRGAGSSAKKSHTNAASKSLPHHSSSEADIFFFFFHLFCMYLYFAGVSATRWLKSEAYRKAEDLTAVLIQFWLCWGP